MLTSQRERMVWSLVERETTTSLGLPSTTDRTTDRLVVVPGVGVEVVAAEVVERAVTSQRCVECLPGGKRQS